MKFHSSHDKHVFVSIKFIDLKGKEKKIKINKLKMNISDTQLKLAEDLISEEECRSQPRID